MADAWSVESGEWGVKVSQADVHRLAARVLQVERERDAARAEAGACRSEAIENKAQLLAALAWKSAHDELYDRLSHLQADRDALHAENAELRRELALTETAARMGEYAEHQLEAEVARLQAIEQAARAFYEHHQRGQPGTPDSLYPMTYGALDQWHTEWDQRLDALGTALQRDSELQAPAPSPGPSDADDAR